MPFPTQFYYEDTLFPDVGKSKISNRISTQHCDHRPGLDCLRFDLSNLAEFLLRIRS